MRNATSRSRGFTLIAALLLLTLMSGIAVGVIMLVGSETRMGGNNKESNVAYYGAEAGMEKLTADLAQLYQVSLAPSPTAIANLANNPPTPAMVPNMNYVESIKPTVVDAAGNPLATWGTISAGPNAGLTAEKVLYTLQVNATRPGGANVNMLRNVEVALIPVFQFGVFSDSDLSYFAGPRFDFRGRVHTNGNLYVASGSTLVFYSKVTAAGQIIRDRLANDWPTSSGYGGTVYAANASGGCNTAQPATNCLSFAVPQASWSGGIPSAGAQNPGWFNISTNTYNGFIANNATGVTPLTLPFVGGASMNASATQIQIIRKPPAGESATSPLGASREYNKAEIRVILADTLASLHTDGSASPNPDGQDVWLGGLSVNNVPGTPAGSTSYFAQAQGGYDPNWFPTTGNWNFFDSYLRVEYLNGNTGNWVGVTNEWLGLGFARSLLPRNSPGADVTGHPNAILIFQKRADRNSDGAITPTDTPAPNLTGPNSQYSWYPINFYDAREGFPRDSTTLAGTTCYANGVVNAVEIDVANLRQWLLGAIGASGPNVNFTNQNGYILYFSDRRGMVADPNVTPVALNGASGLEDVTNSGSANGSPDGALDPVYSNGYSPEDVDENNLLDNWGAASVGGGFKNLGAGLAAPFLRVDCLSGNGNAYANKVSGARHVLKLVDAGLGNLPTLPPLQGGGGGFTVVSENPVYVQGNYNSSATDPFWSNPDTTSDVPHAAAAIIADAVTFLSANWSDFESMKYPSALGSRPAANTYYRMAIAAGKGVNFQHIGGTGQDFGTDGGMHNFLRYTENWGGQTLGYRGSLVSLYYSQYATGTFKCCTLVYSPPARNYQFDTLFLNPANLPPGTPMFQDIVNLSYRQDFTPY